MKIINNLPKLVNMNEVVNELINLENTKAPNSHASIDTSYGTGSSDNYGHVKVSDNYKTSDGTASTGVAASSKAVADAYDELDSNMIKTAIITGTIITEAHNHSPSGFRGVTPIANFNGYPSNITQIVGFLPIHCYYSDYLGIPFQIDNTIGCIATIAETFNVKGTLLYI